MSEDIGKLSTILTTKSHSATISEVSGVYHGISCIVMTCRYIERRCKILEACPALMYNEGVGERIEVWDKERKQVKFTNVKHVRSLLFKTMEREVKNFCDQSLDSEQNHQQV